MDVKMNTFSRANVCTCPMAVILLLIDEEICCK